MSRQREIAGRMEESKDWNLKINPDDYLSRYPNGPNADKARCALKVRRDKFRQDYKEAESIVKSAIEILIRNLGNGIHQGEDDYNLHKFLKDILWKCFYPILRDAGYSAYEDIRKGKLILRRKISSQYGIWVQGNGDLGRPKSTKRYPVFWKKKQKPNEYLWGWGRLKANSQNYYLAKAAIVPIEKTIWKELRAIESVLRERLSSSKSIIADYIYEVIMDKAGLMIIYGRYRGCQSIEFFREIEDWLNSISLKNPIPDLNSPSTKKGAK